MKFEKKKLAELMNCYAVCPIVRDGRSCYIFATDDEGPCICVDAETGEKETVWNEPGGTMSIVPLPRQSGDFLASQNFLPTFAAKEALIVRAFYRHHAWHTEPWLKLPYVHRFDILERNGSRYFLGCILSCTKEASADWDAPGYLCAAVLDPACSSPEQVETIGPAMHRNHGYWKFQRDGYDCALTACDEGVFEVIPPQHRDGEWQITRILAQAASDAVLVDIDKDGEAELAVIEPFHGSQLVLYHKQGSGYVEMYRHPKEMKFLHALWGGCLQGEQVLIAGYRELDRELFMLTWRDGHICTERIECGGGASNLCVVNHHGNNRLLVANREADEAVVFDCIGGE